VFFTLNRDTFGCWAMRWGRRRGARLSNLSSYHRMLETTGANFEPAGEMI
jgi:hypothetical protein